jgi:PKD repeat protein
MTHSVDDLPPASPPTAHPWRARWLALAVVALVALLWLSLAGSLAASRARAYPQPAVAFGISIPGGRAHMGDSLVFTATPRAGRDLTYTWDFGDGQRTTGAPNMTHDYDITGTFIATLIATDPIGQRATTTRSVTVYPDPPQADFTFTVDPSQPLNVTFIPAFNTRASLTFSWDFGDGSSTQTSAATAQHVYTQFSTYTITLTETDSVGQSDTTTQTITLARPATQATFSVVPAAGSTRAFTFDGTASTGSSLSYSWAFGDGIVVQGATAMIEHTYTLPGTYTVTLVVTDAQGGTSIATIALVVS